MNTRFSPIQLGAPGEEISKKDLHAITLRFKNFNLARLQRVQEFFVGKQRDFLNLLPLIFHINHPLLPGFVSLETPAGIADYAPNKQTLASTRQFSNSLVYKRKLLRNYPILGIYLMGSVGSMAFSKDSDIDIWLCYQPDLAIDKLDELQRKCLEVEKWAAALKIEAHFFLINPDNFKAGINTPISRESSGGTQHTLLLEEFYRTSIYIAGRIPVWWLVPPQLEKQYLQYVAHLLENRFISAQEVLDFGCLQNMPVTEFVSATAWHIYKSLSSPHKSLLKLFLMEVYASEFPEPSWLCLDIKQSVYQGHVSVDHLDQYLLIYNKVDSYLKTAGSTQRLNLARECFHLKVMGSSITSLDIRNRQPRENFLRTVALQWHWPPGLLENLGMQKYWTIEKACTEHVVIRSQLQTCLRIIIKIVGNPVDYQQSGSQELKLISRKLKSSLDLRPGKVEVLTTRNMVHVLPEILTFVEQQQADGGEIWCLYSKAVAMPPSGSEKSCKHCDSFPELLCWAIVNGIYSKNIQLKFSSATLHINKTELAMLMAELHQFLNTYFLKKIDDLNIYSKPNCLSASMFLLNLGESLHLDATSGQFMLSDRSDPFSYGEHRHCLVQTVHKISVSTWGEVSIQAYRGFESLLDCITDAFNNTQPPLNRDRFKVMCFTQVRGKSIAWRVNALFDNLLKYFSTAATAYQQRYILVGESAYYLFCMREQALSYLCLESQQQLLVALEEAQPQFTAVLFDAYVLENTPIPYIYTWNIPGSIQLFYHVTAKHLVIYIIDEKGSLFNAEHSHVHAEHVLIHYVLFLNMLLDHALLGAAQDIICYEIQKNSQGVVTCQIQQIKPLHSAIDLQVRIAYDLGSGSYVIYCNDVKFSILNIEAYQAVKSYIQNFRNSSDDYPIHITEIDVPCRLLGIDYPNQAQAVHFLRYKQKMEDKLNIYAPTLG